MTQSLESSDYIVLDSVCPEPSLLPPFPGGAQQNLAESNWTESVRLDWALEALVWIISMMREGTTEKYVEEKGLIGLKK